MSSPNILFLTIDCLRSDHVGCYGYDRPTTPTIDRLAADGTQFIHSYSNCPGTRWAFQSLHTGRYTVEFDGLGVPTDYPSPLAEHLRKAGYRTAGFSRNGFVSRDYGYDRGFDHFVDVHDLSDNKGRLRRLGARASELPGGNVLQNQILEPGLHWLQNRQSARSSFTPAAPDQTITDLALDWIQDGETDSPFFTWIHFMNAHTPYGRWDNHLKKVRGDTDIEHVVRPSHENGEITLGKGASQAVIDAYDAGIRSVDECLRRLVEACNDETLVIITGDHGEEFGHRGEFHEASLYSNLTQVPIIINGPQFEGTVSEMPAQHLDLPPTMVTAAGETPPSGWRGESLQTCERTANDPLYFYLHHEHGVRVGDWKLIDRRSKHEIYHTPHGGADKENVANKHPNKRNDLADFLKDHRKRMTSQRWNGKADEFADDDDLSNQVEENLEDLGYIE